MTLSALETECEAQAADYRAMMAPPIGVRRGMDFDAYRAVEALSQSGARKILRSPLHFVTDREQPAAPTDAMQFGSAVHCGILEPDEFDKRYVRGIKVDKRTKDGKAAWADFLATCNGRAALSADEYDRTRRCIDAVLAHPAARRLLEGTTDRELSLFWQDGKYKVPCKARLDAIAFGGIVDIKTTSDASRDAFSRSIATYGYDLQSAFYFSGHEHALDSTPEFFAMVCVESEAPHAVAVYELGPASILAGGRLADEALATYADALASGEWRGYDPRITRIDTPRWARTF